MKFRGFIIVVYRLGWKITIFFVVGKSNLIASFKIVLQNIHWVAAVSIPVWTSFLYSSGFFWEVYFLSRKMCEK